MLISNLDLDFWNPDPKIRFRENLWPNIQKCLFCLKIGTYSISRMLIPNLDLDFWYFDPKIYFLANLAQKIESSWFFLKIGANSIWRSHIPNPGLDFWNSDPEIYFWANLDPKIQNCLFCLEIGTHGISNMLILISTLVLWIWSANFLFGEICTKKVKGVGFNWKMAHMISRGCWFFFQH